MEHTSPAHVVAISLNDRETPSLDKIVPVPVPLFIGTENVNSSREGTRPSIVISGGFDEISTGSATNYHSSTSFRPLHSLRSAAGFDLDDFCSDVHPEPLRLFARYFVYLYADPTLSLLESNPSAPFSRQCSLSLPFSFHPPPLRFESF